MEITLNPRFLSLVVHDLRTPLNVIGLSLHIIDRSLPPDQADIVEDLRAIRENVGQMERMLTYLADYCRLVGEPVRLSAEPFDPRTLLEEQVQTQALRAGPGASPVQLEFRPGCPATVALDQRQARLAIQHALNNATVSADGRPVRVGVGGGDGRWVIEIAVDRPAKSSVRSTPLQSDTFERLIGTADDRLGLDLAIVARVTELFGGAARLDVAEGRGTTLVLDWPDRLEGDAS